ncbi:MAG: hypothetical protein Udaeo_03900 [Candidatus Udaeobacter sp.]|nr:MAG: hypothetical protein Udaeo_03900 [Candidatus Udaeobacter sp.]
MLARGVPRFPTFGKMYRSNRLRSLAAHQSGRRDRLPSCVCRLVQGAIDDAAQDALRKTFSRRIDRRDSPKMDRYLFIVLDHLKLRMIHANSFSTQPRSAENNDALTCGDHFLHVMQIEPAACERFTQRIWSRFLQRGFKDFLPAAKSAQRRLDHLPAEADGSVGFFPRKLWELGPILMTPGEMR